jgi:integrase
MAKKNNRYRGVYVRKYPSGRVAYGIDFINPETGQRVKKILKGVKSESEALKLRNIEFTDVAIDIISKQRERSEYVFCHLNGNPFKTNIQGILKNAAKRAGVELPYRKAWHIFRRTWASMFLQNGGDVETLRVLGNWKDPSMPLWYADAGNTEYKRKILNRIPKLRKVMPDGTEMERERNVINLTHR